MKKHEKILKVSLRKMENQKKMLKVNQSKDGKT